METKIRQTHRNLLSNSLTARLKQSNERTNVKHSNDRAHTKHVHHNHTRQSVRHFINLNGFKAWHNHDLSPRDHSRDKESSSKQDGVSPRSIQKQALNHGPKAERERSVLFEPGLRSRSDLSSASLLPRLVGSESSMSQVTVKEEFPQFAFIDKDDLSHVKVFKLNGVFQPQNKYYNKIEPIEIADKTKPPEKKESEVKSPRPPEERGVTVSPHDQSKSRMSRMSKKGLRVSWSRRSQYYSADEDFDDDLSVIIPAQTGGQTDGQTPKPESRSESREESVKTPSTTKSFSMKSENFFVKKRAGKRKVETVGIKWAIPQGDASRPEETIRKPVRTKFGNRSNNLMPVSTALDKNGRSINKMRWKVQSADSLRKAQAYQNWVEKLVDLKAGRLEILTEKHPNRANLSVMTQPVK